MMNPACKRSHGLAINRAKLQNLVAWLCGFTITGKRLCGIAVVRTYEACMDVVVVAGARVTAAAKVTAANPPGQGVAPSGRRHELFRTRIPVLDY